MLSEREQDVLALLADGLSNKQIAERLFITYNTVKWYNTQIYNKLGVNNREDALTTAQELGLLSQSETTNQQAYNLPIPSTEFIGRDLEIARIIHLLHDPKTHLVTITAPGGMGKTRLLVEVARQFIQAADADKRQPYFVALAPVIIIDHVIPAIAEQVGYQFSDDHRSVKQQLFDYLRPKNLLLLLDNCEHILHIASLIHELLQNAPNIKILVTSREVLSLSNETVVAIGGMTYPESTTLHDVMDYSAVQLFVSSAQRVRANFIPQGDDWVQIAQICRLVEGMPLAIILSATWVRTLSLQEIAAEITQGSHLLEAELHDLPPRQHSIQSVFSQTWAMLNTRQQNAFARMSVFRGDYSRQAIQAVADVPLPTLKALVNKSLIDCSPTGRYTIHELLRQYAQEQLDLMGDLDQVQQQHSVYYLEVLRQRESDLKSYRQLNAVSELERDFENIRNAGLWAIEHKLSTDLSSALEAFAVFGLSGSRTRDVCELLFHVWEGFKGIDDGLAGRAFVRYHLLASNYMHIIPQTEKYLESARQRNDVIEIANALRLLAQAKGTEQHLIEEAIVLLREALEIYQQQNNEYDEVMTLVSLGYWLTAAQQHLESIEIIQKSYQISRKIGAVYLQARAASFLGTILANRFGRFDESAEYYREAIRLYQDLNASQSHAHAVANLAFWYYLLHLGDLNQTSTLLEEAYTLADQSGNPSTLSHVLLVQGLVNAIQENHPEAKQLLTEGRRLAIGEKYKTLIADCGLGIVHCGLGDLGEAKTCIKQVLTFFLPNFRYFAITIAACVDALEGHLEDATEKLSFVLSSEVSAKGWMKHWSIFNDVQPRLQTDLTPHVYQAACERGKSLTLKEVVERLLAE